MVGDRNAKPENTETAEQAPTDRAPLKRMRSLDTLRGAAVLMVLVVHAPWPAWILDSFAGNLIHSGAYGVDLFFVLSGYLISRLLFAEVNKTGTIRLGRFWLRRGFKIWPSYYVAFLLAAIVTRISSGAAWSDLLAWPNFVFIQNYFGIEKRWFASWSLAVEEHFYTTLPLLLLFCVSLKKGLKLTPPLMLFVCVLAPVLRGLTQPGGLIWIQTHLRMDALCWGVLLGYAERCGIRWPFQFLQRHVLVSLSIMIPAAWIVIAFPYHDRLCHCVGFTLVAVSAAIWTGHAVAVPDWENSVPRPAASIPRLLSRIGVHSYTIYLCQQLVRALINASKQWPPTTNLMNSHGPQIVAFIVGSLVSGWVLTLLIEQPFLTIRDRVVPRG